MSTYARSDHPLDLPRAGRAAAPFAALALLALLFEADPRLPWLVGVAAAAVFAAAAGIRAFAARRELAAVRRTADRLIVNASHRDDGSTLIAWRERELTGRRERDRVRRDIARTLRALDASRLPSASPLKRPAGRANAGLFARLDQRLADTRPVSARGILLAESLLRSEASPLYHDDADTLLPRALSRVLGALEL
jgi:hypothetical protein